ncbi:MAG TPA: glycosyltransferase family A protein [Thermodesulfovibrionia bacterium]|nr:glycosyltransferase family A protein [Thermodesulfovibrionia bacterium]
MKKVSIVINTYNRAYSLQRTLQSLRYLNYKNFEVIVVNGPSDDDTEQVLKKFSNDIKIEKCPEKNLAVSRNIGIYAAKGDIVAFVDDDAIPEPQWLDAIVSGFDVSNSDEIGGVGGFVYDYTGANYQFKYIVCDRFGNAEVLLE